MASEAAEKFSKQYDEAMGLKLRRVKSVRPALARRIVDGELKYADMTDEDLCVLGFSRWFIEKLRAGDFPEGTDDERLTSYAEAILADMPDPDEEVLVVEFTGDQIEAVEKAVNHWAFWRNIRHNGVATIADALTTIADEWADGEGVDLGLGDADDE